MRLHLGSSFVLPCGQCVQSLTVTPTAADPDATIEVKDMSVGSDSASSSINLVTETHVITIVATGQDGVTTRTHTMTAVQLYVVFLLIIVKYQS